MTVRVVYTTLYSAAKKKKKKKKEKKKKWLQQLKTIRKKSRVYLFETSL